MLPYLQQNLAQKCHFSCHTAATFSYSRKKCKQAAKFYPCEFVPISYAIEFGAVCLWLCQELFSSIYNHSCAWKDCFETVFFLRN